jgi:signal transduction histidine kinase
VLRGREVSVRAVVPPWEAGRRKGLSPEALVAGTGYTPAHFRDPSERVSWAGFATFLRTLGGELGDEELVALGVDATSNPLLRALLLPGRLLLSPPEIFSWGSRPDGPLAQLFAVHEMAVTVNGDTHLVLELRMRDGYPAVREHWLITRGAILGIMRAFGIDSDVQLTMGEAKATYEVRLPRPSILVRARRAASFAVAVRDGARSLRRANDELHLRFLELQREVDARRRAEEEFRVLNAELQERVEARTRALAEANRELATFAASAAHDLRTPLRAISAYATMLADDYADRLDDDARHRLGRITAGAEHMATMIDALLGLARINRIEIARTRFDLAELADEAFDQLRASEPARAVEITIERGLFVEGDRVLLRSVIDNLAGNAWKFTRDRTPAKIAVVRAGRAPVDVFSVRDDGIGFDMGSAKRLFEPFVRLHSDRAHTGNGIGLALAARIVRRHGGRMWADATPGGGATFSFTLAPDPAG